MKPYGREKNVNGSSHIFGVHWKKDFHVHDKNHRKLEAWWEGICSHLSRTEMKRRWKKDIEKKLEDE